MMDTAAYLTSTGLIKVSPWRIKMEHLQELLNAAIEKSRTQAVATAELRVLLVSLRDAITSALEKL